MPLHNTAAAALRRVERGHRIFVHGAAATPQALIQGLIERANELKDVELIHLHTIGDASYASEKFKDNFRVANLFLGKNMRGYFDGDRVDYLPAFLSEIPMLFRSGVRPIDVALIQVSPPDRDGYCSLGTSVDVAKAAVDSARFVIAEINEQMPRVYGAGRLHIEQIDEWIEISSALPKVLPRSPTEVEIAIGQRVADRVVDGSTLQIGIGAIPEAVLQSLNHCKNLGLHSELWSDGALDLILKGVINNSQKVIHPGKSVSTFLMGSQKLYDFVNENESVVQFEADEVNRIDIIARNPKVVAINSAVEVDLTGQICSDSIGRKIISGIGGQLDFIRGASLSEGGQPIIALPSRTKRGEPRIVPELKLGAGVVTTRGHVHIVITEYGIADLYGKTLRERAKSLIEIAHPEDREMLLRHIYQSN